MNPKNLSEIKKIAKIINSGKFSDFLGMAESVYFDAKEKPYNLDDINDRYEIAKDVSALANSKGGYIIIGLKAEKIISKNVEVVKILKLIKKEEFRNYKGAIKDYVYPKIKEIETRWIPAKEVNLIKKKRGIGFIFIPKQNEEDKYFLIKKILDKGQPIKEIVFGVAQRIGDETQVFTIKQLWNALKHGRSTLSKKLRIIEQRLIGTDKRVADVQEIIKKIITEFINEVGTDGYISTSIHLPGEKAEERLANRLKDMKLFNE